MHLILTGATGLVGSATLHAMVRNPQITHISILSRRPVPQATTPDASKKCTVHLCSDFSAPPPADLLAKLKGAKGCVWALGVSSNDVDKKVYREVTVDYPLVAAKAFAELSQEEDRREGATTSPGIFTPMFGVVKGEAESSLLALLKEDKYKDSLSIYAARAGAVDKKGHKELEDALKDRRMTTMKRIEAPVITVLRPLWPGLMSPTWHLGEALVLLASGDGKPVDGSGVSGEGRIIQNTRLRRLAGL